MTILSILNKLAAEPSRLAKEAILKANKDNADLKNVFYAAYNPDYTYWISKTPAISHNTGTLSLFDAIFTLMEKIASRAVTGNAAIDLYQSLLCDLSGSDAEVLRRIIGRDLRCGVGVPTINKIWPNLIPTYELMLASTDPKNLRFPNVVCQTKFDGLRCLVTRTLNDEIVMRTRNGNQITSLSVMEDSLRKVINPGETWDGELICYYDGKPMSRKVSNGILNKAIRETISPAEAKLVKFIVWDMVDLLQSKTYNARLAEIALRKICNNDKVIMAESWPAHNLEAVEILFEQALQRGEEGIIAKNLDAKWQPKRTFDLVKFKAEETADLRVVGWEEGLGKYKGMMGALICESSDGKIRVNVGTGYRDSERILFTANVMLDKIIEVCYNAKITKKAGGIDSLYLPRFLRVRHDKSEANSSKEIK
jgi:hypothetical protein